MPRAEGRSKPRRLRGDCVDTRLRKGKAQLMLPRSTHTPSARQTSNMRTCMLVYLHVRVLCKIYTWQFKMACDLPFNPICIALADIHPHLLSPNAVPGRAIRSPAPLQRASQAIQEKGRTKKHPKLIWPISISLSCNQTHGEPPARTAFVPGDSASWLLGPRSPAGARRVGRRRPSDSRFFAASLAAVFWLAASLRFVDF